MLITAPARNVLSNVFHIVFRDDGIYQLFQQAIRFNLFHILQASARTEDTGVPAKGLTGQAYEGHYFWDTEIYTLSVVGSVSCV